MARSEQEIEAEQERARRRLLAVEGALLLLLLRRVRPLADVWRDRYEVEPLVNGVARDVVAGRRAAAEAGYQDISVAAFGAGLGISPITIEWGHEVQRAEQAARGLVTGLQRHVRLAALDDIEAAAADAARWATTRAELTAATEASEAWNAAREQAIRDAIRREPALRLEFFKVWDSELDKRTCDICAHAHGTIVLADEDFPDGTPGHVHPRCRCTEHLLRRDEIDLGDYAGERTIQ